MTQDNAPLKTHRAAENRLEWPGLVALALDRPGGIEVGQFYSQEPVIRAEVEARVKLAFAEGYNP